MHGGIGTKISTYSSTHQTFRNPEPNKNSHPKPKTSLLSKNEHIKASKLPTHPDVAVARVSARRWWCAPRPPPPGRSLRFVYYLLENLSPQKERTNSFLAGANTRILISSVLGASSCCGDLRDLVSGLAIWISLHVWVLCCCSLCVVGHRISDSTSNFGSDLGGSENRGGGSH